MKAIVTKQDLYDVTSSKGWKRWKRNLLAARVMSPEEHVAHDEDPRPGVWAGEYAADLRTLTQEETNTLVRYELWIGAPREDKLELERALGKPDGVWVGKVDGLDRRAWEQRGGIDSDPLSRLLAYRAWGDRDRKWFEPRGYYRGLRGLYEGRNEIDAGSGLLDDEESRMNGDRP